MSVQTLGTCITIRRSGDRMPMSLCLKGVHYRLYDRDWLIVQVAKRNSPPAWCLHAVWSRQACDFLISKENSRRYKFRTQNLHRHEVGLH